MENTWQARGPLLAGCPGCVCMYTCDRRGAASQGGALRLLLRVPLVRHRVSPRVLQGAQAQGGSQLYVDGGDIKVGEICKSAERREVRGFPLSQRLMGGRWVGAGWSFWLSGKSKCPH